MIKTLSIAASVLTLATTVLGGCETISYTTCADNIVHWYNPTNGEVCDPLDCGGGRAPVKYDVPCCAAYRGTEPCVSTTSTLSCWKPSSVLASSTAASTSAEATEATVTETAIISTSTGAAKTSESDPGSSTAPMTTTAPTTSNAATTSKSEESSSGSVASSESASPSDSAATSSSAAPVSTNIAGGFVGSLKAVAGAAIGAIVLV
ncbi:uncharacterized protein N7443_006933 [Penicillium atrosanguineum]|uniref:Uncharacterized protein n=1 Tax=Penicillium atrosanguineum TaxID=1132637 RepID=A0A9W9U5J5_9EURO|nr:uncharacterized protein N7443_006933 [Penicillium atrosanguineum]KAJ5298813.1 hypothetical protein N7443_006933 [Penicillium atrosanguineum]KAJ5320921.1 hypothetical protein N7476_003923 [Penicillium atrosanguineum]